MMGDQLRALIPVAWRAVIDCAITETELEHLAARLDEDHREIFPPREQWFRALDETPLCDVRAVILGQDTVRVGNPDSIMRRCRRTRG